MLLPRQIDAHLKETVKLSAHKADFAAGLRAAAATIVPLAFGEATHRLVFTWMAFGGWLAGFADPGGSYRSRAWALSAFLVAGSFAAGLGSLTGHSAALTVAALFAWALAASLARVFGAAAGQVGNLSLIIFCIAVGRPAASLEEALLRASLLGAGALGAAALALALWPIHAYGPARAAVAEGVRAVAECARAVAAVAGSADERTWAQMAQHYRPKVRAALEAARASLAETRESGQRHSPRASALVSMTERAELTYGVLVALSEVLQTQAERGRPDLQSAERLAALARVLEAAAQIPAGQAPVAPPAPAAHPPASATPAGALLDRLEAHVRNLLDQRAPLQLSGAPSGQRESPPPLLALRAALSFDSLELRYAVRMAIAVASGALAAQLLGLSRPQWVTVTIVIVLQPHAGATLRKGLSRVAGTLLGASAAAVLAPLLQRPVTTVLVLFFLTVVAMALRKKSYTLFGVFVTPLFVLMAESTTGDLRLTLVRIVDTLVGGAVAIAAAHALWPSWERDRVFTYLAASLESCRAYLRAVLSDAPSAERQAARRAMGLAHINSEASFERFLSEPHPPEQVEPLMALLSQARRFSAAAVALSVLRPSDVAEVPSPLAMRLDAALADLAACVRERRPCPEVADLRALLPAEGAWREPLERVARPIELMQSALGRLAARMAGGAA